MAAFKDVGGQFPTEGIRV